MKHGGPRGVLHFEVEEGIRPLLQAELMFHSKVNRCRLELARDFDCEEFPLCQHKQLSIELYSVCVKEQVHTMAR